MTRVFEEDGTVVPVTVVRAGPCVVTQIKTREHDGYVAVQVGFDPLREKHVNKPMKGHFQKSGGRAFRHVREFKVAGTDGYQVGQEITVGIFAKGEKVLVSGRTKGKGFQGVVRRHGHKGGKGSHGSMFHRAPGSSGAGTSPGRVLKGRGYPGHMGDVQVVVRGLRVIEVRESDHLVLIGGGLPGANGGLIAIHREAV
ncbi:MAG: 50S ribosomal protein L3 [Nitrospirae bacterium]|nr:50S ribosomal protein L3 [Nitrospirota bacterium]